MADETAANGNGDQTGEIFYDSDRAAELSRKVEVLEQEKVNLATENAEAKERVKKLTMEIEKMRSDEEETRAKVREMESVIEQSEEARVATAAIAARAASLETEVARLQHDLIQAMTEAGDACSAIDDLNKALVEKGARIEALEREVESLKAAKAKSEKREKELERELGVLEAKEVEENRKKVRDELEFRETIGEKNKEIGFYQKRIKEVEYLKSKFESAVRAAEEKGRVLELKVVELQREIKEKAVEAINGAANAVEEIFEEGDDCHGPNLQWHVVAAGAGGAIVAGAALLCVLYARRR